MEELETEVKLNVRGKWEEQEENLQKSRSNRVA
jgi:hypothetical protein